MNCPVCGEKDRRYLGKNEWSILFGCKDCGSNYQQRIRKIPKKYDEDYFKSNHKKAYGKTYSEDEKNIRSFSKRRLAVIRRIAGLTRGTAATLLDIGSALGTFCDEANHGGFKAKGAEISAFARAVSKKRYGIKTFRSIREVREKFDCVTLWFTLEHMENPSDWIKRCRALLKKGGILAVSVPNGDGAFARFKPAAYFRARPQEHHFEPSIRGMRELLERNGFKTEAVHVFGLHPERLGLPVWPLLQAVQKILKLGDTFEIYARRK